MRKSLYHISFYIVLFICSNRLCAQISYNWPCQPFEQQHPINGTFCENRPDGSGTIKIDHFHDGVDIDLDEGNNVYSVIDGRVTGIGTVEENGINAWVRVGLYAYVHVIASPGLRIGDPVKAFDTVIGKTNSWNHIHFKDGYPGQEINALRKDGGLSPFTDSYLPAIDAVNFYSNGTTKSFADQRLTGPVDIVAKARDRTDNGVLGDNNGIYGIGYQVFDSSGTVAVTNPVQNFTFYQIPPSDAYVTNVYFPGSDLSNYYYIITNQITSDSYWDTREYTPGKYKIRVFTTDTYFNETERWTDVEVMEPDLIPPVRPSIMSIEGDDTERWQLSWLPNSHTDISGYKVFFSIRGDIWTLQTTLSDQLGAGDTSLVYENFKNHFTAYFRLVAYDNAIVPNFSDSSDVYGVRLSESGPQVLIVNGFSRKDGYFRHKSNPFVINYGQALSTLDVSFNSCSDSALILGKVHLSDYPTVIYFTGDDRGDNGSLSRPEQGSIRSYLQEGGSLILCGSEIGSDLFLHGDMEDSLFFNHYLKSVCLTDSSQSSSVSGIKGTLLEGFSGQLTSGLRPDVLVPSGSEPILEYGDHSVAGIFYRGMFPGSSKTGNLVYLAFPVDQLDNTDDQNTLIEYLLNLIEVIDQVENSNSETLPFKAELHNNYPNPFNPQTTLELFLSKGSNINLAIYSLDGRMVRNVHAGYLPAGTHRFIWHGTDASGRPVSSGIYLYQLRADQLTQSKKMVLLR